MLIFFLFVLPILCLGICVLGPYGILAICFMLFFGVVALSWDDIGWWAGIIILILPIFLVWLWFMIFPPKDDDSTEEREAKEKGEN